MALWLVAVCVATAEPPWNYLDSVWCPSPLPALHMFRLKDLVLLEPISKLSATYENGKKTPVSYKLSAASRINSLCLIPKLSKSMAQPDCCCRLTQAEMNGIVASGCVCGDRRASMKSSWFHMTSICSSCSSHVSFERSGSTWTNFQTQCNLWKRKKTPVSYLLRRA